MRSRFLRTARWSFAGASLVVMLCATTASTAPADILPHAQRTLAAFRSDDELRQFLRRRKVVRAEKMADFESAPPAPAATMAGATESAVAQPASSPGITNNQEAGVDEGDIVKVHGQTMVILRRGRLFTVSLARGGMHPIDSINAYAPGVDARDDWYDEMLISGDRIVVIGYSYGRGGTEVNRFRIDDEGRLRFEDSYQLRSNDYYSSRNYASRLIGNRLIFYSPLYLSWGDDPLDSLPALRRWSGDPKNGFRRIIGAQQVYIPSRLRNDPDMPIEALHTVTSCNLTAPVLDCTATSVLGPASRTFYVSSNAVYVWVTPWQWRTNGKAQPSLVYRLPLDGSAPSAVGVRGIPTDQFSFREDRATGALDVLVHPDGGGDAMWNPEFANGALALVAIPARSFGDGDGELPGWRYRLLPKPGGDGYDFHNRFVGDYLLYGTGNGWGSPSGHRSTLVAVRLDGPVTQLPIEASVDRIEAMGRDAVVVGSDEHQVAFQAIELTEGAEPRTGDRYSAEASQAETRSHAFFFRPDADAERDDSGMLGLPVARPARAAYRHLFENSAAMIFLRRSHRQFAPLGELDAQSEGIVDDSCVASCVDWYGNARPIFLGRRTFALLGYELVEGEVRDGSIRETGRISFAASLQRPIVRPPS